MDGLTQARIIEGANAEALFEHAEVAQGLFPDVGAAALRIAGGVASFVGADVPVSYSVGLGLNGPVTEEEIQTITDFFRLRGAVPRVDVCPLADETLLTGLRKAGFGLHWFVNVLSRELKAEDEIGAIPEGIQVRMAKPEEAELWTRTVDSGFNEGKPMTEAGRRLGLLVFSRPAAQCYFAEMGGKLVGGAALLIEKQYAGLAATSTLEAYRNRGVHAALIRARLKVAKELGCNLCGFFASPGSISQRNAERHGFRVAYTKAVMRREE
jgi:GNAT superfamily N-acetyltransferase